jgi:hypothetical protein
MDEREAVKGREAHEAPIGLRQKDPGAGKQMGRQTLLHLLRSGGITQFPEKPGDARCVVGPRFADVGNLTGAG